MPQENNVLALIEHFIADLATLTRREAVAAVEVAFKRTTDGPAPGSLLLEAPLVPPVTPTRLPSSVPNVATRKRTRTRPPGMQRPRANAPAPGDATGPGQAGTVSETATAGEATGIGKATTVSEAVTEPPADPTPADVHEAEAEPLPDPIVEKLVAFYKTEWKRGRRAGRTLQQLAETANVEVAEVAAVVAALVNQGSLVRRDVTNDYVASKAWLRG